MEKLLDGIVTEGDAENPTVEALSESDYLSFEDFPDFQKLTLDDALGEEGGSGTLVRSIEESMPQAYVAGEGSGELEWDQGCAYDMVKEMSERQSEEAQSPQTNEGLSAFCVSSARSRRQSINCESSSRLVSTIEYQDSNTKK